MAAVNTASQLLSGGVSGVLSTAVAHPVDRLKMMVIRDSAINWSSLAADPSQLLEGLSGSLVEAFVYNGTNFGVYETLKAFFFRRQQLSTSALLPPVTALLIGSCAGAITSCVSCPFKVVAMRQSGGTREGYMEAVVNIWNESSVQGFFKGLEGSLLSGPLDTAFSFFSFDLLKSMAAGMVAPGLNAAQRAKIQLSAALLLLLGAIAKAISVTLIFPLRFAKDKVQSLTAADVKAMSPRSQKSANSISGTLERTVRKEGLLGVYSGLVADLSSSCLKNAIKAYINERLTPFMLALILAVVRSHKSTAATPS